MEKLRILAADGMTCIGVIELDEKIVDVLKQEGLILSGMVNAHTNKIVGCMLVPIPAKSISDTYQVIGQYVAMSGDLSPHGIVLPAHFVKEIHVGDLLEIKRSEILISRIKRKIKGNVRDA